MLLNLVGTFAMLAVYNESSKVLGGISIIPCIGYSIVAIFCIFILIPSQCLINCNIPRGKFKSVKIPDGTRLPSSICHKSMHTTIQYQAKYRLEAEKYLGILGGGMMGGMMAGAMMPTVMIQQPQMMMA